MNLLDNDFVRGSCLFEIIYKVIERTNLSSSESNTNDCVEGNCLPSSEKQMKNTTENIKEPLSPVRDVQLPSTTVSAGN